MSTATVGTELCPYCLSLLDGDGIACPACGTGHHGDCWNENGRQCAVTGCGAQGSAPPPQRPVVVAAPLPVVPPAYVPAQYVPAPHEPAPQVPAGTRALLGGGAWTLAIMLLLLAITVVSVALVVSTRSNSEENVAPPDSPATTAPSTTASSTTVSTTTTGSLGLLPPVSREQMRQDIQQVVLQFHEDLVNGNYGDAWSLLSARKQEQTLGKSTYGEWATSQGSLGRYLDPTGLDVSIQSVDSHTGEALIMVTGMRWLKPNAKCTQWSGLTWMKYEGGRWMYDPGYSTTPQRTAEWQPRVGELLGGAC